MSSITCWGRVEKLLVAGEQEIKQTKLIFFPSSSAMTYVNRPLGVDQRRFANVAHIRVFSCSSQFIIHLEVI
ncbi:hypothetical protein Taro_012797 [Colocasia esculenta]|uniref:Uncharacterized protein n=1 Tax=Colocasia esculenta TaxID=4460 RepID=A0A843UA33_COLES|nr:hypothetical protein [Colocasia esculenta]